MDMRCKRYGGFALLIAFVLAAAAASCATGEESIWRDYIDWYRQQPATISDTKQAYVEHLESLGLSAEAVRERAAIIERFSIERRAELQPYFFDRTYSDNQPRYSTGPNALLVEAVRDLPPGDALDVHMGQGRNALFLASKGWRVTGFDYSAGGVRAAREAADKAGLKISASVGRHEDFDFGRARWDLIVLSYTWVPLRSPYLERIMDSLKPGGLLVFEHMMNEAPGVGGAAWLPRPNELLRVFPDLRVLRYEDVRAPADWSWRPERIARLVAQK
jgi:SAM-dependent methyltransferase